MPYIGIEYTIEPDSFEKLNTGFRDFIKILSKDNIKNFQLIQFDSDLDRVTDDRYQQGRSRGKIVLHDSDGNPTDIKEMERANQLVQSIKDFDWKGQKVSEGSIKAIKPRSLKTLIDISKYLKTSAKDKELDEVEVQEIAEQLIQQGIPEEEAKQAAQQTLQEEYREPSIRKGVPVRTRTLTSRSDRPWELTQKWRDLMAEFDIGPNDPIPIEVWREGYRHWYQTTDTHKQAQKRYQEGDRYRGIQQTYNRQNLVGKEAEDNPRKRYTYSGKGQISRQVSQMRVKGRNKRYKELADPFRERGEAIPEFEINQQLFFEGWYPEAMEEEAETGFLKPLDANKFREYYYGTARLKGGSKE